MSKRKKRDYHALDTGGKLGKRTCPRATMCRAAKCRHPPMDLMNACKIVVIVLKCINVSPCRDLEWVAYCGVFVGGGGSSMFISEAPRNNDNLFVGRDSLTWPQLNTSCIDVDILCKSKSIDGCVGFRYIEHKLVTIHRNVSIARRFQFCLVSLWVFFRTIMIKKRILTKINRKQNGLK